MAGALLHHRKHLLVVAAIGIEQPVGREPRSSEPGREQVAAALRPKHLPPCPRLDGEAGGERGEEQGRGAFVVQPGAGRRGLVQPVRQPAPGQALVDVQDAEGQARPPVVAGGAGTLDPAHLLAQGGEARVQGGRNRHATRIHLFLLCSLVV